jgi:D-arginine dehydrogenase
MGAAQDTDIVVVGGGIAGVSIGWELAAGARVLLLEAEPELARHTTGRSAALYLPSYGPPAIRALTAASLPRFAALAAELDTPDLLRPRTVLHIGADAEGAAGVAGLLALGGPRELSAADAVALCPVLAADRLRAAAAEDAMDIDVMGLHAGYVRGLKARGGLVRTGSAVTGLRRDGAGWRVDCGEEEFTAGLVIDAAGAWADRVAGLAGVRPAGLRPLRRTVAIAAVPAGPPDPAWPMVGDGAERFYFKPEGAGLLVSPEDEIPSEPVDAVAAELDVALALARVNAVTTLGLRSVRTTWAGLRTFAADREPVAGVHPEHPGFAWFAGQGGYGIQTAPALAAAGAALATGAPLPADLTALNPALLAPQRF